MKWFKRIIWFVCVIGGLFIATALLLATYFEDNVNKLLDEEFSKRLQVPVRVSNTQLSLLHRFPKASIRFENIYCRASNDTDTLFSAEELFIEFDLIDLFTGNYTINSVYLYGGVLYPEINNKGEGNYHIWKPSETESQTPFMVDLQEVSLENIHLTYKDEANNIHFDSQVEEWQLKGNIGSSETRLKSDGKLHLHTFKASGYELPNPCDVKIDNVFNKKNQEWDLGQGKYYINKQLITLQTEVNENGQAHLIMQGTKWRVKQALKLIPKDILDLPQDHDCSGIFDFTASYWSYLKKFDVQFNLYEGAYLNALENGFKKVAAKGSYHYQNGKPDKLDITSFSGKIGEGSSTGKFSIENSKHPHLVFDLTTMTDLADAIPFFSFKTIQNAKGTVMGNFHFDGQFNTLRNPSAYELSKTKINGDLKVLNAGFNIADHPYPYKNLNGEFKLNNNQAKIITMDGSMGESDFQVKGLFKNTLPYLLLDDAAIQAQLTLNSKNVNLNQVLAENTSTDTTYSLSLSDRINFEIDLNIQKLRFRNFKGSNVMGHLSMNNKVFVANNIQFNGMDGSVKSDIRIDNRYQQLKTTANFTLDHINAEQLFYTCENFNQDVIGHKNIRGTINAKLSIQGTWQENLNPILSSIKSVTDLTIDNGELINFEPLMALSDYVSIDELRHIKFERLQNSLKIENQTLFIPQMDVASSAINLSGSGTHSFDNRINYKVQLVLAELLFQNSRKKNNTLALDDVVIIDDGTSKRKIHLYMRGTVDKPEIGIDNKAAGQKIVNDIKKEGKTFVETLKKEFGKEPKTNDSTKAPKNSGIVIEWDEDDSSDDF